MNKSDNLYENEESRDDLSVDASPKNANNHPPQDDYSDKANSDREDVAPLESLLYDGDDQPYERETPEESAKFEAFLNEYKALISDNLSRAKTLKQSESEERGDAKKEVSAISRKSSAGTRKAQALSKTHTPSKQDDWDDEITLLPETYESLDEEDGIFRDEPIPEEEPESDSFSIGTENYQDEDGEFQLSIKFDEDVNRHSDNVKVNDKSKYDPEHPRLIDSVYDFIELFVFTLVCVMVLTTFIFKHSIVEGKSMQNTLFEGDSLIITDLFYTPERYDIVVFEDYSSSLKKAVVKRVIGLPGEKVEVKINEEGFFEVYINDVLLPEDYALNIPDGTPPPTGVWHINENEVFVMGDNRYNSTDSRDGSVGPIDIDCILGKVVLRFYPFDRFGAVD